MSQKKEKYARTLESRVDHLEGEVLILHNKQVAEDRFREAALAIRRRDVEEQTQRLLRRRQADAERSKKRSYLIARILFILALALVVIFLTVSAKSTGPEAQKTAYDTDSEPIKAQLLSADLPVEEENENQLIEHALCQQGYYRDDVPLPYDLQDVMQSACKTYGVDYSLALAVCQTESSFDPNAENGKCWGYMQVHSINYPETREVTGYDPESPDGNIVCGVYLLAKEVHKYDSVSRELMAYNCGETGAARLWNQGISTTEYTRTVQDRAEQWQTLLNQ